MAKQTAALNLPIMTVGQMVDALGESYNALINSGSAIKDFPSVMLWGAPGVGKSQGIRQIAKRIEDGTGKKVSVTDVRLLLFNPIDLRGIPVANEDKTLAIWLRPMIFDMDHSADVVNILFLDEISAAPQSVQAAAYQITLDRVVGEHRLPDNCIVIAAGNRVTDKSVSFKMPKALANRLLHIEIEGSFKSWREWAVGAGINEKVLGFLSARSDRLNCFDATNDDLAFATPRSWEMVSNILNNVSNDVKVVKPLIEGLIGVAGALEFSAWSSVYSKLPKMDDIFDGKPVSVPVEQDVLYALVSSMTSFARENMYDNVKIGNSLTYAKKLKPEYGELLVFQYRCLDKDYETFLKKLPEYDYFRARGGALRNGRIENG